MKKAPAIIAIVAFVILAGLTTVIVNKKSNSNSSNDSGSSSTNDNSFAAVDACNLFTDDIAKQVLGAAATRGEQGAPASSDDINVSTCTYDNNATDVKLIRVASLMVRSPLTKDGVESNKQGFEQQKPESAVTVTGYGEAAYFDQTLGQLSIYDGKNWMILSVGSGTKPSENSRAEVQLMADKVLKK